MHNTRATTLSRRICAGYWVENRVCGEAKALCREARLTKSDQGAR